MRTICARTICARSFIITLLFCCACFSLFAQSQEDTVSVTPFSSLPMETVFDGSETIPSFSGGSFRQGRLDSLLAFFSPQIRTIQRVYDPTTGFVATVDRMRIITDVNGITWYIDADLDTVRLHDPAWYPDGVGTDDQIGSEVAITPTGNLLSSNVQDGMVELQVQLDAIQSAFGLPNGQSNLGAFSGDVISDNVDLLTALQELETALESGSGASIETAFRWPYAVVGNPEYQDESSLDANKFWLNDDCNVDLTDFRITGFHVTVAANASVDLIAFRLSEDETQAEQLGSAVNYPVSSGENTITVSEADRASLGVGDAIQGVVYFAISAGNSNNSLLRRDLTSINDENLWRFDDNAASPALLTKLTQDWRVLFDLTIEGKKDLATTNYITNAVGYQNFFQAYDRIIDSLDNKIGFYAPTDAIFATDAAPRIEALLDSFQYVVLPQNDTISIRTDIDMTGDGKVLIIPPTTVIHHTDADNDRVVDLLNCTNCAVLGKGKIRGNQDDLAITSSSMIADTAAIRTFASSSNPINNQTGTKGIVIGTNCSGVRLDAWVENCGVGVLVQNNINHPTENNTGTGWQNKLVLSNNRIGLGIRPNAEYGEYHIKAFGNQIAAFVNTANNNSILGDITQNRVGVLIYNAARTNLAGIRSANHNQLCYLYTYSSRQVQAQGTFMAANPIADIIVDSPDLGEIGINGVGLSVGNKIVFKNSDNVAGVNYGKIVSSEFRASTSYELEKAGIHYLYGNNKANGSLDPNINNLFIHNVATTTDGSGDFTIPNPTGDPSIKWIVSPGIQPYIGSVISSSPSSITIRLYSILTGAALTSTTINAGDILIKALY